MWQSSVRSTFECEIAKAAPTLMPTQAASQGSAKQIHFPLLKQIHTFEFNFKKQFEVGTKFLNVIT